ncbi:MAG: AMP-binding protein [Bacteroidota bacterium]
MNIYYQGKTYNAFEPISGETDAYIGFALAFLADWQNGSRAFAFNTSGSTGTPKEIFLTRTQMQASAEGTLAALAMPAAQMALVCLDIHFIAGRMMLLRALIGGMNIILVKPSSDPVSDIPAGLQPDFAAMVPLQVQTILDSGTASEIKILNSMQAVLLGGAAASPKLEEEISKLETPFYHTFGMTETASHIALKAMNGALKSEFYKVLPGVNISTDSRGCLTVEGPQAGTEPIITNDVVEITAPGKFRWLGRADNIINTGGLKVQAEKVEAEIQAAFKAEGVTAEVFVCAMPHHRFGQQVTAIAEGVQPSDETGEYIVARLREVLKREEMPKQWVWLRTFVRTATGKTDRANTLKQITG